MFATKWNGLTERLFYGCFALATNKLTLYLPNYRELWHALGVWRLFATKSTDDRLNVRLNLMRLFFRVRLTVDWRTACYFLHLMSRAVRFVRSFFFSLTFCKLRCVRCALCVCQYLSNAWKITSTCARSHYINMRHFSCTLIEWTDLGDAHLLLRGTVGQVIADKEKSTICLDIDQDEREREREGDNKIYCFPIVIN